MEILIPIETWNEIDFSLWIKSQKWNENEIIQECCEVIEKLKLFPKVMLKDQIIERKDLKEFLISEMLGNVLIWKCKNGSTNNFSLYLDGPFKNIVNVNFGTETPFYVACEKGRIEIVKILLSEKRVDINKSTKSETTPFWIACKEGHIDVVEILLNDQRFVNINKSNKYDQTPFYITCFQGHIEIVKLLLHDKRVDETQTQNDLWASFWMACYNGHLEIVNSLLNNERVNPNKTNTRNESPFQIACKNGHIEIVKLLLNDKRISIRKKTKEGKTAIDLAKEENHSNIVKLLQEFDTGNYSK